jgi:hypothetical protein
LIESGWRVLRFWEHELEFELFQAVKQVERVFSDPTIPFMDRAMAMRVEPISSDGSLERWCIEYVLSEQLAYQEIRTRKAKK